VKAMSAKAKRAKIAMSLPWTMIKGHVKAKIAKAMSASVGETASGESRVTYIW
jgi:hypothetical protein